MIYTSSKRIKNNLSAHAWLGLAFGAALYLICLSGTLVVFGNEYERWEQPNVAEYSSLKPIAIETAINQYLGQDKHQLETLWVILPTPALPRAHLSNGDNEWWLDENGATLNKTEAPWYDMLVHLHYYLHLPESFGMIVVGIFGVMMLALTLTGVLAHPAIIKDAFKLRRSNSAQLAHADLHNRLGVWGLPFSVMISLTGSFIGLVSVIVLVAAPVLFDGDKGAVISEVYGEDPVFEQQLTPFNTARAFQELSERFPDARPIYVAFQKPNTENQFLEIAATIPGRLVYSEIFRFSSDGKFFNSQHLSDGPIARQVAYSVYRLHFGAFGGLLIKILYFIFGLALTVVCASGINMWLAKRKISGASLAIWHGFIWGAPLSLSVSLIASFMGVGYLTYVFWVVLGALVLLAPFIDRGISVDQLYKPILATSLVISVVSHSVFTRPELSVFLMMFYSTLVAGSAILVLPKITSALEKLGYSNDSKRIVPK